VLQRSLQTNKLSNLIHRHCRRSHKAVVYSRLCPSLLTFLSHPAAAIFTFLCMNVVTLRLVHCWQSIQITWENLTAKRRQNFLIALNFVYIKTDPSFRRAINTTGHVKLWNTYSLFLARRRNALWPINCFSIHQKLQASRTQHSRTQATEDSSEVAA
jgi:hypothetical protein